MAQTTASGICTVEKVQVGDHIEYEAYSVLRFVGMVTAVKPEVEIDVEYASTFEGRVNLASSGNRTIPRFAFDAGQVHYIR